MKNGKRRNKSKPIKDTKIKEEITIKLGHPGWLKFPESTQLEIEDKYLQMKNLGYI
jgi:hypothetical protein